MIGFFLFIALFPAMLHTAQQPQTYERAAALEALQAWPTRNEVEDWFWLLLSVLAAVLLWPSRLLWRGILAVSRFDLTEFICRLFGAGFDPNGCKLPEWNYQPSTSKQVRPMDFEEIKTGGFPNEYDGALKYSSPETIAEQRAQRAFKSVGLTEKERECLKEYNPPLLNATLAEAVKRLILEGKTDREMAILLNYSESTVKHYRLALERANPSPASPIGERKRAFNAFNAVELNNF